MLKGDNINGYIILKDFIVAGGMSKISFASKGGKEYFIKEFLSPKYPTPDSPGSEKTKLQKRKACEEFEKHHRELNSKIATKVSLGGNLVFAVDFFRYGTCYYKVTEKIDTKSISCEEIARLPLDKILLIAKSVCHSLRILHDLDIVHGDLKPDNILIKKTTMGYSGKLIDFDDSYFNQCPPKERDGLVGTPEYYSPEQAAYIMDEEEEIGGETLTLKSDIFTLGIILSEYFTGSKPILPTGYSSTWSCINDEKNFSFSKTIQSPYDSLIRSMLALNPNDRPTIAEVFAILKGEKTEVLLPAPMPTEKATLRFGSSIKKVVEEKVSVSIPTVTKDTPKKSILRGKLLNNAD